MRFRLTVMAFAAVLAGCVSGCKADTTRDGSDRRGAEGEVLGGTISDGMIPLEAVTSQSPAQRPQAVSGGDDGEAGDEAAAGEGEAGAEGADGPQAAPAPSETEE